jgi:hypothetical protein
VRQISQSIDCCFCEWCGEDYRYWSQSDYWIHSPLSQI